METVGQYEVGEVIFESVRTRVARARRRDGVGVILKLLADPHPSWRQTARFKREFTLTQLVSSPSVVGAHRLENHRHRWLMVLEDIGGSSLARLLERRSFTIAEALTIAVAVGEGIGAIHQAKIIHKDINPSNVVVNPDTGAVQIIDFGIATRLVRERPVIGEPEVLEGTLPYISPEQTGRMNRLVDYRTDFYSLGATLYELLTGQRPFQADDALELVHAHIARPPRPPHELEPSIPVALSEIVLKLLAKDARARYLSAHGLVADLRACREQWAASGQIEPFVLGREDRAERFELPQQLYGREREREQLLTTFERVSRGSCELMLVAGHSGVGKSALVHEVHRLLPRRHGYFVSGKFDQLHRSRPYEAIIRAFQEMIRQILTRSPSQLARWRERLLEALAPNARLVVDVIPELEAILGPQPEPSQLSPANAANRFNRAFRAFALAIVEPERPLVMFLDDLQWADSASLELLVDLLSAPGVTRLLVVGAYRNNAVGDAHPLRLTIDRVRETETPVSEIVLHPLEHAAMVAFVADATLDSRENAAPLAELIATKTGGSPFFAREFLRSLHDEELLRFDRDAGVWTCELDRIEARRITDNVVELLADKLRALDPASQHALTLAAAIGNSFDLDTLAAVARRSPRTVAGELWPALEIGLILPEGSGHELVTIETEERDASLQIAYRFAHDRIQQAAYSLVPADERPALHLELGRYLLEATAPTQSDERLFEIVEHLNLGRELITDADERRSLARLELQAGRKAKASGAYEVALRLTRIGIELLVTDADADVDAGPWDAEPELALALHLEAMESAYLVGAYEDMARIGEEVLAHDASIGSRTKVTAITLLSHSARGQLTAGIELGLSTLDQLGLRLPAAPTPADIDAGLAEASEALAGREIMQLAYLPAMRDPVAIAASTILMRLFGTAFNANPPLFVLIVFKLVTLSVRHGNMPLSARGYAAYGLILCAVVGDVETGYQFGRLASNLAERPEARAIQCSTLFIVETFIRHWVEPIESTLAPLRRSYQTGLDTGDLEYAAMSAFGYVFQAFWAGHELHELAVEAAAYSHAIAELGQDHFHANCRLYHQTILCLLGQAEDPLMLRGDSYDETAELPGLIAASNLNTLCFLYVNKMLLAYLHGAIVSARELADRARACLGGANGLAIIPAFYFFDSLITLALAGGDGPTPAMHERIEQNQAKLRGWATHAPSNFERKYVLVEAERARVAGELDAARELGERALALAEDQHDLLDEALTLELCARLHRDAGRERLAGFYFDEARYVYERWGAHAKLEQLRVPTPRSRPLRRSSTSTTGAADSGSLDLASIVKVSQAMFGEIILDRLIERLIAVVVENAGAERGALLFPRDERWIVEASFDHRGTSRDATKLEHATDLARSVIHYVARTREHVVIDDAGRSPTFADDDYIVRARPRSLLCMPLINQAKLSAILYLENNLSVGTFTRERVEILNVLSFPAAISLDNARLYAETQALNVSLAQEIRERRRAEEAVRHSERRLAQFLEAVPIGVVVFDNSGATSYANHMAQRVLGAAASERALHTTTRAFVTGSGELYPLERLPSIRALAGESTSVDDIELEVAGRRIPLEMSATPIRDEQGEITHAIAAFQDITRRREAEQILADYNKTLEREVAERTSELEEAQEQLVFRETLVSLGALAAGVAHELKNPLNFILNFSGSNIELLDELRAELSARFDDEPGDALDELLDDLAGNTLRVAAHSTRANDIVSGMLAHSRNSVQRRERVNLNAVLVERVAQIRRTTSVDPRPDCIELDTDPRVETVEAAPAQILQLINNLIENALDAVHARAQRSADDYVPKIAISTRQVDEQIRICVRDNGVGIPDAALGRVLEPFFTTKPPGSGTGLGLYICFSIARSHHGTIMIDSVEGSHTTVSVSLPAAAAH